MIFVRNLRSPLMTADNLGSHVRTLYLRELLLWAGWTETSNNGDAAWGSCVLVNEAGGANGFQVAAANPTRIYDSLGRFTLAMETNECAIFLRASNTQNRVAGRILRYIDANNVEIDPDSAPPNGWADEGGVGTYIPGRIVSPKAATLTATTAWALLQAPTGNLQARVFRQATAVTRCFARPKGGAGTATEVPTAGIDLTATSTTRKLVFHAVADGNNIVVYGTGNATAAQENPVIIWGELTDVGTGDTDPGFVLGYTDITNANYYPQHWTMAMLDGNPVPATIAAYLTAIKCVVSSGTANVNSLLANPSWILQNGSPGKIALYRPLVQLANTLNFGGCPRGKIPDLFRTANQNLERHRPIDAAGYWLHVVNGFVVRRNGPNDPRPLIAYAV